MAKGPTKRVRTPAGRALYMTLDRSEVINGEDTKKKSAGLILEGANLAAMEEVVQEFAEENMTAGQLKSYVGPFKERDGKVFLKAKTFATNQDGTDKVIPVFDAKGNPVRKAVRIGNGSVCKLNVTMKPYTMNGKNGITFYLNSVQVIELVRNGNDAWDDASDEAGDNAFSADDADDFAAQAAEGEAEQAGGSTELDDEIPF